jgi:hypothetical protein
MYCILLYFHTQYVLVIYYIFIIACMCLSSCIYHAVFINCGHIAPFMSVRLHSRWSVSDRACPRPDSGSCVDAPAVRRDTACLCTQQPLVVADIHELSYKSPPTTTTTTTTHPPPNSSPVKPSPPQSIQQHMDTPP